MEHTYLTRGSTMIMKVVPLVHSLHMLNVEWRLVYILKQFSEHMHIYYMCIIYNKYTYQYIEEDSFLGIC